MTYAPITSEEKRQQAMTYAHCAAKCGEGPIAHEFAVSAICQDLTACEKALKEKQADIDHAVAEAKKRDPDYPWKDNTASEAVWALGEAFLGVSSACDELHKEIAHLNKVVDRLKEELKRLAPETVEL